MPVQFGYRRLQAANTTQLVDILHGWLHIGCVHTQPALEAGYQLIELTHVEVGAEGLGNRLLDQSFHYLLFAEIANGIQLDFSSRRGDDGSQITDTRCRLPLLETNGTP